jgi:hypothetical protein
MVGGRRPAHQPRNNNRYSTKGSIDDLTHAGAALHALSVYKWYIRWYIRVDKAVKLKFPAC